MLTPSELTITAGNSAAVAVTTTTLTGAPQAIQLAFTSAQPPPQQNLGLSFPASSGISPQPSHPAWVGSLPSGITGTFSPATVTSGGSSTLTLNVAPGVAPGVYYLQVVGVGVVTREDQIILTVMAGTAAQDFGI